ncbi:MAG: hypothetical protein N4A36_02315 [Candidatus Gracilibacteria bacterium]|jgi:predicted oxidoreductase (fatty acid repression mutant protein)|nr:hypothetical protein [Candidatus Gracilibacteria bacterium]
MKSIKEVLNKVLKAKKLDTESISSLISDETRDFIKNNLNINLNRVQFKKNTIYIETRDSSIAHVIFINKENIIKHLKKKYTSIIINDVIVKTT